MIHSPAPFSIPTSPAPGRPLLFRRAYFSCGHRYHNPQLSEAENQEIFGACFNPHGHGHNYILEACFQGPVDSATGMILNLRVVDEVLQQVTSTLDHRFLNEDVDHFKTHIPTTENIAAYCYQQIQTTQIGMGLKKVRLYESEDLWVDYCE